MNSEIKSVIDAGQMQAVIFDMDGVLLDSMELWETAGVRYLAGRGIKAQENLGQILLEMNMEQGLSYMKEQYRLPESTEALAEDINHMIENAYETEVLLKPGMRELLLYLKDRNIPVTVATSSDYMLAEKAFSRWGILNWFKKILTCSAYRTSKAVPDIYEYASEIMRSEKEFTWVFEDSCQAACTAKKADFRVVGVYDASSEAMQERLKEVSDIYLESR